MKTDGVLKAACALPWAIMPDKLHAIFDVLEFHAEGLKLTKEEIAGSIGPSARSAVGQDRAKGSVAILPVYGVLSQRMNMMSDVSGGTSTEQFSAQFDALIQNPQVSAIVLDMDSPGGSTFGIPEAAAKIRDGKKVKPVYAIANGTMASAAYWLGAQATEIIASPSALVGSVGVYMIHMDDTGALEQQGVTRTVISAGANKAEGMGALGDDARAHLQAIVDDTYASMVSSIGKGRGIAAKQVEANYGQGRVFTANAALDAGLVDRIATLDEVLSDLLAESPPGHRLKRSAHSNLSIAASSGGFLVPDSGLTTTAGLTTGVPTFVLTSSTAAPKAQEPTVNDNTTGAQPGAAPSVDPNVIALQQEMARREAIDQLCALAGATMADANALKASGKTAEQVRAELSAKIASPSPLNGAPVVRMGADREAEQPFASFGDQLVAIVAAGQDRGIDKRLLHINAAASGGSANVPSDGAFLIQKDFAVDLNKDMFGEGQLAAEADSTEVGANSDGLTVAYVDETSRATGSRWGGIQVYRAAEADSATAKKPKIGEWEARVFDLIGLAYMTERLLRDAPAMADVFQKGYRAEIGFVTDDEIVRGTGAGQILGWINSPALVSQAKESGQAADTVVAENIINMWGRLLPRAKARANWYINQELEKQLQTMQIGTGTSGQLVYMPPGGLSGSQFGTIYGRPVKVVEQCSAPGDVGDIILADPNGMKLVTKDGVQSDDSIHVRFANNERTFRWITRLGGRPKLKSALTPYKGTLTLSDHVTLAAR